MSILKWLVGIGFVLTAVNVYSASIKEIVNDPRTYVDRTVTVEGDVSGELSLFVFKYFTINDGTGKINVITERPLPRQGQKIRVTGKVKEVFSLGKETLLVLMEENEEENRSSLEKRQQSNTQQRIPGAI